MTTPILIRLTLIQMKEVALLTFRLRHDLIGRLSSYMCTRMTVLLKVVNVGLVFSSRKMRGSNKQCDSFQRTKLIFPSG
jgi:type III secretory pathway component EscU